MVTFVVRYFYTVVIVVFCAACQTPDMASSSGATQQRLATSCSDPRPEVCTMVYQPVCGGVKVKDCVGTSCEVETERTYPSACAACADSSVAHYREGECVE